jgi:hypothetical protein
MANDNKSGKGKKKTTSRNYKDPSGTAKVVTTTKGRKTRVVAAGSTTWQGRKNDSTARDIATRSYRKAPKTNGGVYTSEPWKTRTISTGKSAVVKQTRKRG